MMLKLYTQNNCQFCSVMLNNLAEWGLAFDVINLSNSPLDKVKLKEAGVKTVPALFLDDFWVNQDIDTQEFTEVMFYDRLDTLLAEKTPEEVDQILEKYDANKRVS